MWIFKITAASVCTWSSVQLSFKGPLKPLCASLDPLVPKQIWEPSRVVLVRCRSSQLFYPQLDLLAAVRDPDWNLGLSSLIPRLPFKCRGLKSAHIFLGQGTVHIWVGFIPIFFPFLKSQSAWVTATWNRGENGINMSQTLKSDQPSSVSLPGLVLNH